MGRGHICAFLGAVAVLARAPLGLPARERGRSPCASAALTQTYLRAFLPRVAFEPDSSALELVAESGRASDLDRHARPLTSARSCRLAHRAYRAALGAEASPSEAPPGTVALVRIGSYYLIAEPDDYLIVLASRDWRILSVLGLDND